MTTAAPPRSRDELAALGKKKLEEFRRRKLQKAAGLPHSGGMEQDQSDKQQAVAGEPTREDPMNPGHVEEHARAATKLPEMVAPSETAMVHAESLATLPTARTETAPPEAWFTTPEHRVAEPVEEAKVAPGFFDSLSGVGSSVSTEEQHALRTTQQSVSASQEVVVEKKSSFDARQFMVMVEPEAEFVAPPSGIDDGRIDGRIDGREVSAADNLDELSHNATATATEAETGLRTLDAIPGTDSNNDGPDFLPSRQNKQSSKFQELQDHIDSLTTQNLDLSLCLSQQTTIVQKLTEENEGLVHKLNEASRSAEQSQEREKALDKERELLASRWRDMERQMARMEKENRDLTSKVKVLGGELLGLEEKLLRERNERLKLSAMPEGGDRDAFRKELDEVSNTLDNEREEKRGLQARIASLEAALKGFHEQLAAEQTRADRAEAAVKTKSSAYPIPQSALVCAEAMQEYVEKKAHGDLPQLDDARLPDEVRALLPMNSWIPSLEEEEKVQQDIVDAIGRLYERIQGMKTDDMDESREEALAETGPAISTSSPSHPTQPTAATIATTATIATMPAENLAGAHEH